MLKTHIDDSEKVILAKSKIAANAGHPVNKGTPREIFVKEFLQDHLSEKVGFGTGEIINFNSIPREGRNQIDLVIYKKDYPKLLISPEISAFFVESVVAIIEVKSLLNQEELGKSISTANKIKSLERSLVNSMRTGYQPPSILSYVVAYDGPASMETVYRWLPQIHQKKKILIPTLPINRRPTIASPSIDGIFVLGKGFVQYDNAPTTFIAEEIRQKSPNTSNWYYANLEVGSLFLLFLHITQAISGVSASWLDISPYVNNFKIEFSFGS